MSSNPPSLATGGQNETRVIGLSGIDATATFINLPPSLNERQEREVILQIRTVARGMPWWIGDFARYYQAKLELAARLEAQAAENEKRPPKLSAPYDEVLAEAWDISSSHIRHAAAVATFFAIPDRSTKLSYRHHMDAMQAAGGKGRASLDDAKAWLKKAEGGEWSCADLRENASTHTVSQPAEANPFKPLDSADRWLTQHQEYISALSPDRAANLLTRFQSIVALVDKLRALTGANVLKLVQGGER